MAKEETKEKKQAPKPWINKEGFAVCDQIQEPIKVQEKNKKNPDAIPDKDKKALAWFNNHIGKSVYATKKDGEEISTVVSDKHHATLLYNLQEAGTKFD